MVIQNFIKENKNYLELLVNQGVKKKTYKDLIILSLPYNHQNNKDELLSFIRGIVINKNTNEIVCMTPRKSIIVNDIKDLEIDEKDYVEYEELIDGTMINLFYYNGWLISSRSEIGGYNKWSTKKTFKKMFDECCDFNLDDLSKDYSYSFVMRHIENRNVAPIMKNELYLVEMYDRNDNFKRIERKDYPDTFNKVEYVTEQKVMLENNEKSNYIKGYTIKNGNKRYKIKNDKYEKIKNIKTEMNNDFLVYLELRKNGNLKQYLNHYPEKTDNFKEYRNKVHLLSNELYTCYKNTYIYKHNDKSKIEYYMKPLINDIHKKYLQNKKPITWDDIKDYIYKIDSRKLYFAINNS